MGFHGISWNFIEFHGISWDFKKKSMGLKGGEWDFVGFHRDFMGIYWDWGFDGDLLGYWTSGYHQYLWKWMCLQMG